ncbi:MAG TPA: EF-hand domain-containing protein [Caulobacterales bacterium]|jgi:Ca2+-binding EF-hand superfamily protein|nr:EF-hand domain-containing protein [Caulobacterales bacterium]
MNKGILAALGMASALALAAPAFAQAGGGGMIMAADANKDGKVTLAEMKAAREARFDTLDKNKDGFLVGDELGQFAQMAMRGDKNGDGKIDKAEYSDVSMIFNFLDANKDGAIDQAEVANMPGRPGG